MTKDQMIARGILGGLTAAFLGSVAMGYYVHPAAGLIAMLPFTYFGVPLGLVVCLIIKEI